MKTIHEKYFCSARVPDNGDTTDCGAPGVVLADGTWWCKDHHTSAITSLNERAQKLQDELDTVEAKIDRLTMSNTEYELKTWPGPFVALWSETKRFEWRNNDRGFKVGDHLLLREWNPDDKSAAYSGRWIRVRVTYLLTEGFGIPAGYCVMSIAEMERGDHG